MTDKIDIPSFQIAASKMHANGNAYFKLFEKHIPTELRENSCVLLYKIDNLPCIAKIVNMNAAAKYTVVTNDATAAALRAVLDKSINVDYLKELDFKETDMKFDCIVMNPPYQRNLHLKILAEAIKHLRDERSVCVNLSPVRWLQDPLAKYKKASDLKRFEDSVAKHIESLDIIDATKAQSLFLMWIYENIGIYVCSNIGGYDYNDLSIPHNIVHKKIIDNVIIPTYLEKIPSISSIRTSEGHPDFSKYFVILPMGHGHTGQSDFYDIISPNKDIARKIPLGNSKTGGTGLATANFDTDSEAEYFRLSLSTIFIKFCVSLIKTNIRNPYWAIPYMGNIINPRTGLKGYQSEWTDADFYQYFNITSDEQKVIEETMAKYR